MAFVEIQAPFVGIVHPIGLAGANGFAASGGGYDGPLAYRMGKPTPGRVPEPL